MRTASAARSVVLGIIALTMIACSAGPGSDTLPPEATTPSAATTRDERVEDRGVTTTTSPTPQSSPTASDTPPPDTPTLPASVTVLPTAETTPAITPTATPGVATATSSSARALILTDSGCSTSYLAVPADLPPEVVVRNEGNQPLVFTVPRFAISVQLLPGQRSTVPINPYVEGSFDYFCLDALAHEAVGGHQGIGLVACPIDPVTLSGVAQSSGILEVERHQEAG